MHPNIARSLGIPIASQDVTEKIRRLRPDNIWSIWTGGGSLLSGLYAMVMLTSDGLKAVQQGNFKARDPSLSHLAGPNDPVAAIYKWTIFAPGRSVAGISLMAEKLREPPYVTADLFAAGTTEAGRRIMARLGFRQVGPHGAAPLYHYIRRANRPNQVKYS